MGNTDYMQLFSWLCSYLLRFGNKQYCDFSLNYCCNFFASQGTKIE